MEEINKGKGSEQTVESPGQDSKPDNESLQGPASAEDQYTEIKLNQDQLEELRQEIMQAIESQK